MDDYLITLSEENLLDKKTSTKFFVDFDQCLSDFCTYILDKTLVQQIILSDNIFFTQQNFHQFLRQIFVRHGINIFGTSLFILTAKSAVLTCSFLGSYKKELQMFCASKGNKIDFSH